MGEFKSLARGILDRILEGEREIHPTEIPELIAGGGHVGKEPFHCYPGGEPSDDCYSLAVIVSLSSKRNTVLRSGHLDFEKALEMLIRHMQGTCVGVTRTAVLITDSWHPDAFEKWHSNIDQIGKKALVEIYLLAGHQVTEIGI